MPIVTAILEVNRKIPQTNPALHPDWFEGVSLNGALITDVYIEQGQKANVAFNHDNFDEHWQGHDTSKGIDTYFGIAVAFDSFDEAYSAYSTAHQWEIASGVFLFLSGMRCVPSEEKKRINL